MRTENTNLFALSRKTALGVFSMIVEKGGKEVVLASGFGAPKALALRAFGAGIAIPVRKHHPYLEAVDAYMKGDGSALAKIPVRLSGSDFEKDVWGALRKTKAGETISYGALAKMIGRPGAARAVGTACGENRVILLVPCHRIIRSDGGVGEYAYGTSIKRRLLENKANKG